MRLVRLLALFGSLVLLVATSVSLLNRRAELRDDQADRAQDAAAIAAASVSAEVQGVVDVVAVAATSGDVGDGGSTLAATLAEQLDGAACVSTDVVECSGGDPFALDLVGALLADAAGGSAVAGVDVDTGTVVAVARDAATVVVQVPLDRLLVDVAVAGIEGLDATADLVAVARADDAAGVDAAAPGQRVELLAVASPFAEGAVAVVAGVDAGIGLGGDAPLLYGALLALGTVLLALAGWTFLVERRVLERRATTDELTGLANRREFERLANEELLIADRLDDGLCVMVIDLNGFKQINDTQGHHFGDLVLKSSAERLVGAVRDTDVVARWGGDEFVVLLPHLAERSAVRNIAERIARSLESAPVVGDTRISGSIGAAIFPRHGRTLDDLVKAADLAMYGAKTSGVGHRIADVADLTHRTEAAAAGDVATTDYQGPDRRRSPVPPPPPRAGEPASGDLPAPSDRDRRAG